MVGAQPEETRVGLDTAGTSRFSSRVNGRSGTSSMATARIDAAEGVALCGASYGERSEANSKQLLGHSR